MDAPTEQRPPTREIRPRSPRFDFEAVPRHWFGDSALATHLVNGINLLFPAGERFFVRSVHHYLGAVRNPELRAQVKGFSGQEGRHANAHEKYFETLEKQGYEIRGFLRFYEAFSYRVLERVMPPALRLSTTVACEHFTATLARNALGDDLLATAHPTMRALLLWHAAEEIEHKAVAFDVLREVNPSHALRMAGLAVSGTMLGVFWMAATIMLLRQDGVSLAQALKEIRELGDDSPFGEKVYGRAIKAYLRKQFHPSDETRDDALAGAFLEAQGLA